MLKGYVNLPTLELSESKYLSDYVRFQIPRSLYIRSISKLDSELLPDNSSFSFDIANSNITIKSLLWFGLALISQAVTTIPHTSGNDLFPYQLLKKSCINPDCSATRITISNPPINLWNAQLIQEFNSYLLSINSTATTTPKVVVISSDVPDFYIAHLDLHLLSAAHPPPPVVNVTDTLVMYYENLNLLSSIPVIFVGEITGRAGVLVMSILWYLTLS